MWFILIQVEYEIITKPGLQNDFPIIKGVYAVYFTGFILLIISAIIVFLLYLIKKRLGANVNEKINSKKNIFFLTIVL